MQLIAHVLVIMMVISIIILFKYQKKIKHSKIFRFLVSLPFLGYFIVSLLVMDFDHQLFYLSISLTFILIFMFFLIRKKKIQKRNKLNREKLKARI